MRERENAVNSGHLVPCSACKPLGPTTARWSKLTELNSTIINVMSNNVKQCQTSIRYNAFWRNTMMPLAEVNNNISNLYSNVLCQ